MAHITRLIAVLTGAVAALTFSATAALARPLSPPTPIGRDQVVPVTTVVTHSSSGLAVWAVVLIAVASVAAGILIAQAFRSLRHRSSTHGLATA